MKFQVYKATLVFCLFIANANAIPCGENDVYASKNSIFLDDIFFGSSFSVYGILCNNQKYSILTYLPDGKYKISKYEKNKIGMALLSKNSVKKEYYKFFNLTGDLNIDDKLLPYKTNKLLDNKLKSMGLKEDISSEIKVMENGVFKKKIHLPKSAAPGKYVNEMFIFDKNSNLISWHGNSFEVKMIGNGAMLLEIIKKSPALYVILCFLTIISLASLITFSIELFNAKKEDE